MMAVMGITSTWEKSEQPRAYVDVRSPTLQVFNSMYSADLFSVFLVHPEQSF